MSESEDPIVSTPHLLEHDLHLTEPEPHEIAETMAKAFHDELLHYRVQSPDHPDTHDTVVVWAELETDEKHRWIAAWAALMARGIVAPGERAPQEVRRQLEVTGWRPGTARR